VKHVAWYIMVAVAWLLWASCSDTHGANSQSQTHWLHTCDADTECGSELACECGRCVAPCGAGDRCDVAGLELECQARSSGAVAAMCSAAEAKALCLQPCDGQCARGQRCVAGACIAAGSSGSAGARSGDGGRGGQSGGASGDSGDSGTGSAIPGGGGGITGGGQSGVGGGSALCLALDRDCDVENDQCCAGGRCEQTACTDSIPPNCFGVCRAESGPKVDPSTLPVTCMQDSPHFAAFDRECTLASDCVIGTRAFDCCGTRHMGIRPSEAQAFAASAAICNAQSAACDCALDPLQQTAADDGTTAAGGSVPRVDCVAGLCQTTMGVSTALSCGTDACDPTTEICVNHQGWTTEYACMPVPAACSADHSCACVGESLCRPGFGACHDEQGAGRIACICVNC